MGYFKQFYSPWTVKGPADSEVVTFEPLDLEWLKERNREREERKPEREKRERERKVEIQELQKATERRDKLHSINRRIQRSIRPGWIYFELNPTTRLIKIGFSQDLKRRHSELERIEGDKLETLGVVRAAFRYEKRLHRMFSSYRWAGEWFEPADLILRYISVFADRA